MTAIILFDGICNFCNSSVQFILKRDKTGYFHFASLQSESGASLLQKYRLPNDLNSFVLLENEKYYTQSSAALQVCKRLNGAYKLFYVFIVIPKPIRDIFYNYLAKNRYKWFGKKESCMLPTPEYRKRFLK